MNNQEDGKRKSLTPMEALHAMQRYCAYQDRCHSEVRTRLIEHQVYGDDLEEVIVDLIGEDYLNEERYARSFARGKFKIKGWGKMKIINELKFKKVSAYCIEKGLTEIDDDDYYDKLVELLKKKRKITKGKNQYDLRQKMYSYAARKGYESFLISEALKEVLNT